MDRARSSLPYGACPRYSLVRAFILAANKRWPRIGRRRGQPVFSVSWNFTSQTFAAFCAGTYQRRSALPFDDSWIRSDRIPSLATGPWISRVSTSSTKQKSGVECILTREKYPPSSGFNWNDKDAFSSESSPPHSARVPTRALARRSVSRRRIRTWAGDTAWPVSAGSRVHKTASERACREYSSPP